MFNTVADMPASLARMPSMSECQKTALKLVVVAAIYGIAGVLLYQWQLATGPALLNVFLLFNYPAPIVVLLLNVRIIGTAFPESWNRGVTIATAAALAIALTLLEFFALLLVIFSSYGS